MTLRSHLRTPLTPSVLLVLILTLLHSSSQTSATALSGAARSGTTPALLPECANCSTNEECAQGKCWGKPKLCTSGTQVSLNKCFKLECARCRKSTECASKKCWKKKCVFNNAASMSKCFPDLVFKKRVCEPCEDADECLDGKCWARKCTDGTFDSLRKCFRPECFPCKKGTECATKKCWAGKCVFDGAESRKRCFPE